MSEHIATIEWQLAPGDDFGSGKYSRAHRWLFDGGSVVPASSSPTVVRIPYSIPSAVDPEEAFVASVSSCHMLTFLYLASRRGFVVKSYRDVAKGTLAKNERGAEWVSRVTLSPDIEYDGAKPSAEDEAQLHHEAHEQCFIANSVKTEIVVA